MSDINREDLNDVFDMETEDIEIEKFKEVFNKIKTIDNPDTVLSAVVEKAGVFLDMVERESVNGAMSARYMEVAGQLMNTMITAANSIAAVNSGWFENELKEKRIKQRDREIEQKDKELEIKKMYYLNKNAGGGGDVSNNIIVTDHSSIMKFLENKKTKEIGTGNET